MSDGSRLDLASPVTAIDHVRGPEHARITIVEYGDFECPSCRAAEPALQMILASHPGKVRLIWRHFPLEEMHPHALLAAEAAEAAAASGKFWEMHDLLIAQGAGLARRDLERYAARLGLDLAQFRAALDDEIYRQRVREQIDGGLRSHLRATPGIFLDGRICDVSGGMERLAQAVAQHR